MGNIDAGDTVFLERPQDIHQLFDFGLAESAGRLIQDQDLGVFRERFSDLDHLHFANPQISDRLPGIHIQLVLFQYLLGIRIKLIPVNGSVFHWLLTEVDVFANGPG